MFILLLEVPIPLLKFSIKSECAEASKIHVASAMSLLFLCNVNRQISYPIVLA